MYQWTGRAVKLFETMVAYESPVWRACCLWLCAELTIVEGNDFGRQPGTCVRKVLLLA